VTEKRILALILIAFVTLGVIYAILTPVFEASDELWHYPLVKHLSDGNPLPIQTFDPGEAGPWKQEASQPPLYYYVGAILTFWIDTSDMPQVRWLNPHVDNGVITPDGNINLVVHDPAANHLEGTLLAIRLIRIFSVLMGATTVYFTYRIARDAAPDRPEISLGAAAVNAFMPMFMFISASVNNDNLVIALASLSLLLMIGVARREPGQTKGDIFGLMALGLVIGLGALTKISAVGLLLLALTAVFIERWRYLGERLSLRLLPRLGLQTGTRFLLILLPALLVAGWWYYRNWYLYGDWSGWNAFIAVLGQRAHPASLAQLWDERWGFMASYWGLFGGLNVPMPDWIYRLLNGVFIVSVAGIVVYVLRLCREWFMDSEPRSEPRGSLWDSLLGFLYRNYALLTSVLWSVAIVAGLIRWATITWSSQGRLVFTAISALSTLLLVGLVGWLPRRPAITVACGLGGFLLIIALLAPFAWIRPAYEPGVVALEETGEFRIVNERFNNKLNLVSVHSDKTSITPGDTLAVTLVWQVLDEMKRDWSIFVHLEDPILDTVVAQRDMYPGQGLLATRLLEPGQRLTDHIVLQVPETAIAPAEMALTVGLYDLATGERMLTAEGMDALAISKVLLNPVSGAVPNPIKVDFEDQLEVVGFEVDRRRVTQAEPIRLTLYWQSRRPLDTDYTFFAQLVDDDTTRWASQDISFPTSSWAPGETQSTEFELVLDENVPAGVYPLIIGVYTRTADGGFDRLQTLTDEGRLTDDFLLLTHIRVD
jgi:hypothetical protein